MPNQNIDLSMEDREESPRAATTNDRKDVIQSSKRKSVQKWLFAAVIAASVAWVCLFTILASHTDVMREKIYTAFETKYFPEKAGARVFTYIGVFYLWLGTVVYVLLHFGVRLPKPSYQLVRTHQVPLLRCHISRLEAFVVAVFISTQVATVLARVLNRFEIPWWSTERIWYEMCKTIGKLVAFSILIILFPVSKNCFWWDLFNFQFERAIKLHRWIAWSMFWLVVAHALTAIVPLIMVGEFKNCMWTNERCQKPGGWGNYQGLRTSEIYTYGWIALLFYIPMVVTSLPWFRRNRFEWFYYTHFLFIPFFVMIHLHYSDMIYFTAPGFSAYILDKTVWFVASRRRTRLVQLAIPAAGYVRITIALDKNYSFLPGQWVRINIPAISFWEWHPMSVASAPGHSTIDIDVKVVGNWSEKLLNLAARFDPSKPAHTTIFVDGFHGSCHREAQSFLNHKAVAMFGGGIGLTPMMSALRTLVEQSHTAEYVNIRKVVFVWCVRKQSVLELYRDELAKYQSMKTLQSGCELDVIVHCTYSEEEDEKAKDLVLQVEPTTEMTREPTYKQGPFVRCIFGYKHQLALTVFTGCSFLLGIFTANVTFYEKDWKHEYESLLQLFLGVGFAALSAFAMMCNTFFRRVPSWQRVDDEDPTDPTDGASLASHQLAVVEGRRPDFPQILTGIHSYCTSNGISSVGVAVCGPQILTEAVNSTSRACSTSSVQFLVDEESFEW